jgi:DNA-binding transcriptional MerR regulator
MQIQELAQRTGLPPSTIRYYESIDLLPPPRRQPNGYRLYREADVDRLRLVAGLRALDFSIDDIAEILALRDQGEAPCRVVLELLAHKADEIQRRVTELERLETELRQLHRLGLTFPTDNVDGKNCVCHLVSQQAGGQQAGKEKT